MSEAGVENHHEFSEGGNANEALPHTDIEVDSAGLARDSIDQSKRSENLVASSLARDFEADMILKTDDKPLMVSLVEACRRIFADCRDLNPEKVSEIRQLMQNVRCSDVGLPESMRLTNIEYIHVLEVYKKN